MKQVSLEWLVFSMHNLTIPIVCKWVLVSPLKGVPPFSSKSRYLDYLTKSSHLTLHTLELFFEPPHPLYKTQYLLRLTIVQALICIQYKLNELGVTLLLKAVHENIIKNIKNIHSMFFKMLVLTSIFQATLLKEVQGQIFWAKLIIHSQIVLFKYLISSPSNSNFCIIRPWLGTMSIKAAIRFFQTYDLILLLVKSVYLRCI